MSEKEILLAVATPEEWWKWADDPRGFEGECLLCKTYLSCVPCKSAGGHDLTIGGCHTKQPLMSASESAAARLIRAGIERPE